jgi:hypothetical protein
MRVMRGRSVALLPVVVLLSCGGGGDEVVTPATPAPAWDAPAEVGDVGLGYPVSARAAVLGGPTQLAVDSAGNAYLALHVARPATGNGPDVNKAWATVYRVSGGWMAPESLLNGTQLPRAVPTGVGLTPEGALFGWAVVAPDDDSDWPIGLRGYDRQQGWRSAGRLLNLGGATSADMMLTDASGIPSVVYSRQSATWLVRHTGALVGPELVFDGSAAAFAADGRGNLAVASFDGALAIRSPAGTWTRTTVPSVAAVAGRPDGGFALCQMEPVGDTLTYAVASLDSGGNLGPSTTLGSVRAPSLNPLMGTVYDPKPKIVVGAGGDVAVAWHAGTSISFSRQSGGQWQPLQTFPASGGGYARLGYTRPFDLALDRSGTLLVAWHTDLGVVSAQWAPGQTVSPTTTIADDGQDILLAMNADGVAFLAWRVGPTVMAARSTHR